MKKYESSTATALRAIKLSTRVTASGTAIRFRGTTSKTWAAIDVFARLILESPVLHQIEGIFKISSLRRWERFTLGVEQPAEGFEELWTAMAAGASIEMRYAGGSRPGLPRRVTPQRVLEMRGILYFVAFCHQGRCDKTFRLDRIQTSSVVSSQKSS